MKALVVGCGKVGSEIVRDLAMSREVDSVTVADANPESLARVRRWPKVQTVRFHLGQKKPRVRLMKSSDLVCGALPGRLGFELMREAVDVGIDIVDISNIHKDPLTLDEKALARNCIAVPQCGVAPGFSNMCVGDAVRKLEKVTRVAIYVGGLPRNPVPPLNYRAVFSLEDVIDEYNRPVRIIENGRPKIVEPLSGTGFLSFPRVGRLEYFLTDGLGTLPRSFPQIKNMHELTLRYPGHAEIVKVLRTLGYFDDRKVRVDGHAIEPKQLTLELLRSVFSRGTPEDLLAFRVEVEGRADGRRVLVEYQMLDHNDQQRKVSAMARTTAYPCTSVALMVGLGKIPWKGVVPPEKIAGDPDLFRSVLSRLREHGIRLSIHTKVIGS